jgi:lipopolysaccharide transport system ATP-binding protein
MIEIKHISKVFKLYKRPSDRLRELFFRRSYHHYYQALNDVSLSVKSGETCGVIGKNGAGKSTLLKILTAVLLPDSGEIITSGKVTGLLELGTGFDAALSGRQNITANGLLLGMNHAEIESKREAIIEFSELVDFIDEPLRTYSSGMAMRLAFSIAIHAEPKCFVIDEALSVGDAHFQQKCMRRIRQFRDAGGSIIFVSHDLNAVKMLCDKVLVLDNGRVVAQGSAEEAVNHYNKIIAELDDEADKSSRVREDYGTRQAEIISATICGEESGAGVISAGETAIISLCIKARERIEDVTAGIMIRDRFGQDIFGTNSHHLDARIDLQPGRQVTIGFAINMAIAPGKYTLTAALHSRENHLDDCYHWYDNVAGFDVAGVSGPGFSGVCRLATRWVGDDIK